jgi:nucleotide-binding universal stress UspA family protein
MTKGVDMTTAITETAATPDVAPTRIFSRVLVGVDGSPEGFEAARQAARLHDITGELALLSAWILPMPADSAGMAIPYATDPAPSLLRAEEAVAAAKEQVAAITAATAIVTEGTGWDALLREGRRRSSTLIAVGSHGLGRALGVLFGSTATELVHKAPCSVLVARLAGDEFPRTIVVGVDGSPESAAAYAAARRLAKRFGAKLWPVVAHGGKEIDRRKVAEIIDQRYEELQDEPVTALVAAAAEADLVVVGSRGVHGLKSLGSVSERVAHRARCSTLIVREPEW